MKIDLKNIEDIQQKKKSANFKKTLDQILNYNIRFSFNKKISDKNKEKLFSELGVMLNSGIDFKSALEIVFSQFKKEREKKVFQKIYNDIIQGDSFGEILKNSGLFAPYDYYSIIIGEKTGNLDVVLKELGEYYNNKLKQRRKIINALTYPVFVLFLTILVVFFLKNFLIPMFEDIFQQSNKSLPSITQFVINASAFFNKYFYLIIIAILIIIGAILMLRKNKKYKIISSSIILRIPIIGNIVNKIYMNILLKSFSLLLFSKVSLIESIQLIKEMINFHPFQSALDIIEKDIIQGEPLNEAMQKHKIFNQKIYTLVKIGEEVNKLPEIFNKLSEQNQEDIDQNITTLNSFLEPFLIVFIGGIVAFVLIAMYLPMFQLSSSIF